MMTKKQISELPKGTHLNSDLNRINPEHCVPKEGKAVRKVMNVGTTIKPVWVSFLANRQQRKNP